MIVKFSNKAYKIAPILVEQLILWKRILHFEALDLLWILKTFHYANFLEIDFHWNFMKKKPQLYLGI